MKKNIGKESTARYAVWNDGSLLYARNLVSVRTVGDLLIPAGGVIVEAVSGWETVEKIEKSGLTIRPVQEIPAAGREVELDQVEDIQEKPWRVNGLVSALEAMGGHEVTDSDAIGAVTVLGKQHVEEIKKALNVGTETRTGIISAMCREARFKINRPERCIAAVPRKTVKIWNKDAA